MTEPSELALRDWVRTRLNASVVRELADLDYGMHVEEYTCAIEELLVARRLPDELEWNPGAVLELSSFATIEDQSPVPGSAGWRAHVARLFSCMMLTRTGGAAHPAGPVAGLVESALALGPDATAPAARFLAWCRAHRPGDWRHDDASRPFLTLGLLLLYDHPPPDGQLLTAFADEVRAAVPVEHWWADGTPSKPLKKITGGDEWRLWRSLVARRTTTADAPLRAWFKLD